jgi:signal transduction histidine kinase
MAKSNPLSGMGAVQFGRRIGTGFAATVLLAAVITVVSVFALRSVISTSDLVAFNHAQDLLDVEKLRTVAQRKVAIARGYLLAHDGLFVEDARMTDIELRQIFDHIQKRATTDQDRLLLGKLRSAEHAHDLSMQKAFRLARIKGKNSQRLSQFFNDEVMPKFDDWERTMASYAKAKERQLEVARQQARDAAARAMHLILVIAVGALLLAITLGFVLTKTLTRLYDEVRIAVRAREDVLAIVSHDLKNPLSAVMLSAAMIIKTPDMPEDLRNRMARTIHTSAQQMRQLIEDLLDFVKVEFGRMKVTKKLEDPHTLTNDILSVFQPLARDKNIELHKSVDKSVTSIECDRGRIIQIISNLLGNAIKFTPASGWVSLNVTTVGDETLFWVRDTGPGIPPEQLSRVFDRYWQAEKSSRQGVGLGLAIAKGLVEAHGGRIWAESQPGEGSTFYFTLPLPGFKTDEDSLAVVEGLKTALMHFPSARAKEAERVSDEN